jgi:hypothetical protein
VESAAAAHDGFEDAGYHHDPGDQGKNEKGIGNECLHGATSAWQFAPARRGADANMPRGGGSMKYWVIGFTVAALITMVLIMLFNPPWALHSLSGIVLILLFADWAMHKTTAPGFRVFRLQEISSLPMKYWVLIGFTVTALIMALICALRIGQFSSRWTRLSVQPWASRSWL